MTEPTDDELDALIDEVAGLDSSDEVFREFARAVLAKWGTPAPVVVEPMTARELADRVARGERWRIASTQQPTQPQAGAVPLTLEAINAMAREYPAEDLCGWSYRMGVADAEALHAIAAGRTRLEGKT